MRQVITNCPRLATSSGIECPPVACGEDEAIKRVFVLELNEVSPGVLRRLIDTGYCPNFKRLRRSHVWLETSAYETYPNLEPWIQWVTVHTGLTQAEHKVFN